MVIKHERLIKTTSVGTTILITIAFLAFISALRAFARATGLPPSITQLTIWLVLLTPYAFSRRVSYSMVFSSLALTLGMIYLSSLDSHRTPSTLANAYLTTTVSAIMVAIIAEVTFRFRARQALLVKALREAREVAEKADQAKGNFLANMSHEIRTPISGIMGVLEILKSETTNPRQHELIEMATDSSDVLLNIVNNILDYSKIEAGKLELANEIYAPSRLFEKVARNFALMAESKGIEFTSDIDDSLPDYIEGDRYRFRQILTNLISNAIKYTDTGSVHFYVKGRRRGSFVAIEIRVSDTGIGIPLSAQEKLFTPFEQGDSSYRKSAQGTGLGLSITKFLVEKMGGQIKLESREGVGTQFTVTAEFPITDAPEAETAPIQHQVSNDLQGTILLAEDNKVNQMYIIHFLEKAGFRVKLAENGREALSLATNQQFDAILMDIQMPEMSGIEATQAIRVHEENRSLPRTPIFALTASATEHDRSTILSSGIDHFCPKPVDMRSLLHKLQKIVG